MSTKTGSKPVAKVKKRLDSYLGVTRSGTYGFLAALPLFIAYEVLILLVSADGGPSVRVGADVWIKQAIASIGEAGMFVTGIVVVAVGIWIVYQERKLNLPLKPRWFGLMMLESLVYAVFVAFIISRAVQGIFQGAALLPAIAPGVAGTLVPAAGMAATSAVQALEELGLGRLIALSLGAGLYEELVFRVILVGGLAWILHRVTPRRAVAYAWAAVIGALLFSAVHYIGAYGDVFTFQSFTFRFLFGIALNGLYLARGFGVAAWTHAIYDVLVVTQLLA